METTLSISGALLNGLIKNNEPVVLLCNDSEIIGNFLDISRNLFNLYLYDDKSLIFTSHCYKHNYVFSVDCLHIRRKN